MQKSKMSFPKCLIGNLALLHTLLLSLFLIGCSGLPISKSENTIAIVVFENATEEPLLELQIASTFKEVFIRGGILVLSTSREADFILSGKVNTFEQTFLSLNSDGQASESRVTIGLEYTVSGKGLVSPPLKSNINTSADYFNNADPTQDRIAKDRAIREASLRLAEKVANDLANFLTNEVDH